MLLYVMSVVSVVLKDRVSKVVVRPSCKGRYEVAKQTYTDGNFGIDGKSTYVIIVQARLHRSSFSAFASSTAALAIFFSSVLKSASLNLSHRSSPSLESIDKVS